MKKTRIIAVLLTAVLLLAACASNKKGGSAPAAPEPAPAPAPAPVVERRIPGAFPDFVKKAILNQPEDALVGIGSARMATLDQSRTISATRGRAELSRQMNTVIQDMVRDYTASSEVDPSAVLSFQENITVALSKAELRGARVVDQDRDEQGNVWTVVMLDKASTVAEITQAQAAAKLAVPAMASFSAEERMNAAFDRLYNSEVQVGDR